MADSKPAKPAPRCPGWYHENNKALCDLDQKAYAWVSKRKETTHGELESYRAEQHQRAGILAPTFED